MNTDLPRFSGRSIVPVPVFICHRYSAARWAAAITDFVIHAGGDHVIGNKVAFIVDAVLGHDEEGNPFGAGRSALDFGRHKMHDIVDPVLCSMRSAPCPRLYALCSMPSALCPYPPVTFLPDFSHGF